jgi:hypothetical protein
MFPLEGARSAGTDGTQRKRPRPIGQGHQPVRSHASGPAQGGKAGGHPRAPRRDCAAPVAYGPRQPSGRLPLSACRPRQLLRSPAVRRFWLFLFAFLLALQSGWAASHGYAHDVASWDHSAAAHEVAPPADQGEHDNGKRAAADHGCCGASHSCHGSPALMAHADLGVVNPGASSLPATVPSLKPPAPSGRHERPQWLPA